MPRDNGKFWEDYTLEDAKQFLWSESVGSKHPSRLAAQRFLANAGKNGPISILEVPCAAGAEYEALSKFGDLTCMDRTPVMLRALQERYPEAKTLEGDIRCIPLEEGQFDWVYARAIFEHLPGIEDVHEAMRDCLRVSKKGCIFSFFIPPEDQEIIAWNGSFFNNTYALKDIMRVLQNCGVKEISTEKVSVKETPYMDDAMIFYVTKP